MPKFDQKGIVAFIPLLLIFAGIIVGVYLVQHPQIFKPKASYSNLIANLTNNLISAKQEYSNSNQESKEESLKKLEAVAIQRKEALVSLIKSNPQSFLDNATLVDRRAEFPEQLQQYIEKHIEENGAMMTLHGDNFEQKKFDISYDLLTDNQQYILYFAKNSPKPVTGLETNIAGIGLDNNIVVRSGESIDGESQHKQPTYEFNKIKIGIFLISLTNMKPEEAADLAEDPNIIREVFFGEEGSVKDYFLKNSYNKLLIEGDILGSYTVDDNTDTCTDEKLLNWSKDVEKLIPKDTLNQYDSLIYVLPDMKSCEFGGRAPIGNLGTKTIKNNVDLSKLRAWITNIHYQTPVYIHELGHNLGVHHANGLDCGNNQISQNCESKEYLDVFDVMGNGWDSDLSPFHMDLPHKLALGWLTQQNIQTVTESGTYKIKPLEKLSALNDILGLKIFRPKSNDYYFLEYRQRLDYDTKLPEIITRGALLHIWNGDPVVQTQLVHINAGNIDIKVDPAFFDDKVFTDSINNIQIKQISHNENEVTLNIQMP